VTVFEKPCVMPERLDESYELLKLDFGRLKSRPGSSQVYFDEDS